MKSCVPLEDEDHHEDDTGDGRCCCCCSVLTNVEVDPDPTWESNFVHDDVAVVHFGHNDTDFHVLVHGADRYGQAVGDDYLDDALTMWVVLVCSCNFLEAVVVVVSAAAAAALLLEHGRGHGILVQLVGDVVLAGAGAGAVVEQEDNKDDAVVVLHRNAHLPTAVPILLFATDHADDIGADNNRSLIPLLHYHHNVMLVVVVVVPNVDHDPFFEYVPSRVVKTLLRPSLLLVIDNNHHRHHRHTQPPHCCWTVVFEEVNFVDRVMKIY